MERPKPFPSPPSEVSHSIVRLKYSEALTAAIGIGRVEAHKRNRETLGESFVLVGLIASGELNHLFSQIPFYTPRDLIREILETQLIVPQRKSPDGSPEPKKPIEELLNSASLQRSFDRANVFANRQSIREGEDNRLVRVSDVLEAFAANSEGFTSGFFIDLGMDARLFAMGEHQDERRMLLRREEREKEKFPDA